MYGFLLLMIVLTTYCVLCHKDVGASQALTAALKEDREDPERLER